MKTPDLLSPCHSGVSVTTVLPLEDTMKPTGASAALPGRGRPMLTQSPMKGCLLPESVLQGKELVRGTDLLLTSFVVLQVPAVPSLSLPSVK